MPKIATSTQEPNRQTLKIFQECIQDQAMTIASSDLTLSFLGLVLKDSSFITLSANATSFVAPTDPGINPTATNNATAAQMAEALRIFNIEREEYKTFCEFKIILISMITNSCPKKYLTALKLLEMNPLSYSLSNVVETLDILWMLSEEESGLENVECKQTNQ